MKKLFTLLLITLSSSVAWAQGSTSSYPNWPLIQPTTPIQCTDNSVKFEKMGLAWQPKLPPGNYTTRGGYRFNLPKCFSFYKVRVELDVYIKDWDATKPDALHNAFWLYRGQYRSNTWGNVNIKGPNAYDIRAMNNLDVWPYPYTTVQKPPYSKNASFPGGLIKKNYTYHVVFEHDTRAKKVTTIFSDPAPGGASVTIIDGSYAIDDCYTTDNPDPGEGDFMNIEFGHGGHDASSIEKPTPGWQYSNVKAEFFRCSAPPPINFTVSKTAATCSKAATATVNSSSVGNGCYTYKWTPGNLTTQTVSLAPGDYTVVVTDAYGCTKSAAVNIPPVPGGVTATKTSVTHVRCFGGKSGSVTITPGGGTGPYKYSWTPAPGTGGTTNSPSQMGIGTYSFTVTDAGGCKFTDTVMIKQPPAITLSITQAGGGCGGGSATATAVAGGGKGPYTYSWSTTPAQTTVTATGLSSGPYTVNVKDNNNCAKNATVNIAPSGTLIADAGKDTSLCRGDSIKLSASGGITYSWTPIDGLSNAAIPDPVASPTVTTKYIVTVTEGACSDKDTVLVTVHALPPAEAGADLTICPGEKIKLTATGGSIYSWNDPQGYLDDPNKSDPEASPLATTTFTVTVTDNNLCSKSDTVQVIIAAPPEADAGPDKEICRGKGTQLVATGGTTFVWEPTPGLDDYTSDAPMASPNTTSTYVVTVSYAGGTCSDKDTVIVTVNPLPTANAGLNDTICPGQSVTLNASGGVGFEWSPSTDLNDTIIANPIASPTVTTNYTVKVTDSKGCTDKDAVKIVVLTPPVVNLTADTFICKGAPGIALSASGGITYSWTPSSGLSSNNTPNPVATPTNTTTYTVNVTDAKNCSSKDSVIIEIKDPPVASAGSDVAICKGSSTSLSASGGVSYSWAPAGSLTGSTGPNPTATPSGNTTYTVTVTAANQCTDMASVTVTLKPTVIANAGMDTSVCKGTGVKLTASGGSSYSWIPQTNLSSATIASPVATPTVTTTYVVTVGDPTACSNTDTVIVTVNSLPVASAGSGTTICIGASATLNASGGISYSWSPAPTLSNAAISNPVASPSTATTYTVTVKDAKGCTSTATVEVDHYPKPDVLDDDAKTDENQGTTINVIQNDKYTSGNVILISGPSKGKADDQSNGNGMIMYTPEKGFAGTDLLTYVLCDNACPSVCDSGLVTITVIDDRVITVPQGFSPDGNGVNDQFVIEGILSYPENELTIFNRWGDRVYEASPYRNEWNGAAADHPLRMAGDQLPDGTYFYVLKLEEGKDTMTGYVIINR